MNRCPLGLMKALSRTKPLVKSAIEAVENNPFIDIGTINVPEKWMVKGLEMLKSSRLQSIELATVSHTYTNDRFGKIYVWNGSDRFVNINKNNSIEIKTGEYIFEELNGTYWISQTFMMDANLSDISELSLVKDGYYSEYLTMINDRLNKMYDFVPNLF